MSEEGRRVYVGNLDKNVAKEEVEDLFTRFGRIESLWLAKKPSGFAFVVFETLEQADDAVREMNGFEFKGQALKVEVSTSDGTRKRRTEGGRREPRRDRYNDNRRGERRHDYDRAPRRDYYDEPPREYERRDYDRRDYTRSGHDYDRRDYYDRAPAGDYDRYYERRDYERRDYYDDRPRGRSRSGERRYYDDRR